MNITQVMRWTGILIASAVLIVVSIRVLPVAGWMQPPANPTQVDSFTVGAQDPLVTRGVRPADILGPGGLPSVLCSDLGLTCTGTAGAVDQVESLSYGLDFVADGRMPIEFSVAPGAQGITGTAVRVEANCNPAEPQADVFGTSGNGANAQIWDGNGVACGGNQAPGLYLTEGMTSTNLLSLDRDPCQTIDPDCDGVPESLVYLTLGTGSPTLATVDATPADILITQVEWGAIKWADGVADLGLRMGDVIDALCVNDDGDARYDNGDKVVISLAPGSPTLSALAASPADLLLVGGGQPAVLYPATSLGLQKTDNLDAVLCSFPLFRTFLPVMTHTTP